MGSVRFPFNTLSASHHMRSTLARLNTIYSNAGAGAGAGRGLQRSDSINSLTSVSSLGSLSSMSSMESMSSWSSHGSRGHRRRNSGCAQGR